MEYAEVFDEELFDKDMHDFLKSKMVLENRSFGYYEYYELSLDLCKYTIEYIGEYVNSLYFYIFKK